MSEPRSFAGPERRRYERTRPARPQVTGRARLRRQYFMMPGLQAYRWYSVLEGTSGAAQLPPPLAGYMWIDVGGPQFRSVPRDWFEIEEGPQWTAAR